MVDKTWDHDSSFPFSAAEILNSGVSTSTTRAIFVNNVNSNEVTIQMWFRDNTGPIEVPIVKGEIYPFGITQWNIGGTATATSAEIWGLW